MMIEFAVIWAHGIHRKALAAVRGQYFGVF